VLLMMGLMTTGMAYAGITAAAADRASAQTTAASETLIEDGRKLFLEGCSSCHGLAAQGSSDGPSLIGVGAAAVHFQVATGRMPMAANQAQAQRKPALYNEQEIAAMAAYVASLGAGPAIPSEADVDGWRDADIAAGGIIYRLNCSQCHQAAGGGGALSEGRYAPSLMNVSPLEIYEAMLTGPQSMPVFNDAQIPVENKQEIIAYIMALGDLPNPGGLSLGRLGPVTEGLFVFTAGLGLFIAAAVWLGARSR
jgi:ubiquinol-cytochrome c reductase cytochrome c subunit